jgi:hypothetical protein
MFGVTGGAASIAGDGRAAAAAAAGTLGTLTGERGLSAGGCVLRRPGLCKRGLRGG